MLAYVKYIREHGKTPEQAVNEEITLKKLLTNLQELDDNWMNINPSEIKTSPPRTLIQRLNIILLRWRTNTDKVQKALDLLPLEQDQSEQVEALSVNSDSGSDKVIDEQKQESETVVKKVITTL